MDQQVESVISDGEAGVISRVEELAYELKVEEAMTQDMIVAAPDEQLVDVLERFGEARISGAPVVDDDQGFVGIISIEDLIRSLREGQSTAPVREYMTTRLVTVYSFNPLIEALKLFSKTGLGRLPVLNEDDELVGIITKGDITQGMLHALERDYQAEEVIRYRASHLFADIASDRTSLVLRYFIKPRDFTHGGEASSHIKQALLRLGASRQTARRCGIAVYEAEMNLIIHTTDGGSIHVEIEPHVISIRVVDEGPGIEDVERAMKPGYSTAPPEIRELGFGAGMGLQNIKRCVDEMGLQSTLGEGTCLELKIYLSDERGLKKAEH